LKGVCHKIVIPDLRISTNFVKLIVMATTTNQKQIIFFAHGSGDPIWQAAVSALSDEVVRNGFQSSVAYMERASPSLEEVIASLFKQGKRSFLIIPLFLAPGGHMSHDVIPLVERQIKLYPTASFTLQQTLLEKSSVRHALIEDIKSVLNTNNEY